MPPGMSDEDMMIGLAVNLKRHRAHQALVMRQAIAAALGGDARGLYLEAEGRVPRSEAIGEIERWRREQVDLRLGGR